MQIGVVGSGQMGHGIAQVCASKNLKVKICDHSTTQLEKARLSIEKSVTKLCTKGMITAAEKEACLNNIVFATAIDTLGDCEIIIEAVSEDEAVKKNLWQQLDELAAPQTIFASNTSSIPITRLASAVTRSDKMIGMHFMNPVPIMRLVEIIPTMATSAATKEKIIELATILGKETVISQDYPGFIVNRVLMPMINEAFNVLMQGIATASDIDKGMKLGTNQPLGPLALADLIGLDTCHAILQTLHNGFGDPRYYPSPLLTKHVEAGHLGRKTGQGVFAYT